MNDQRSKEGDERHAARRDLMKEAEPVMNGDERRRVIHLRRSQKGRIYVDAFAPDERND